LGGGTTTTTTYDYTRQWSDDAINSSKFKHPDNHQNPEMPFRSVQGLETIQQGDRVVMLLTRAVAIDVKPR
jgi:Transmembrane protein 43